MYWLTNPKPRTIPVVEKEEEKTQKRGPKTLGWLVWVQSAVLIRKVMTTAEIVEKRIHFQR
jgi:hypothetical protein